MHYDGGKNILRSHELHPGSDVSLFIILEWKKENIVSVIEDHLLESISSATWDEDGLDSDFSYLSERYNQFIQNIDTEDTSSTSCLIGLLYKNWLSLATTGNAEAILVEKDDISHISSHEEGKNWFHYISHGDIPPGSVVYLSNTSLKSTFWESFVIEMNSLSLDEWSETVHTLVEEEKYTDVHIFRIENLWPQRKDSQDRRKQSDIIQNTSDKFIWLIRKMWIFKKIQWYIDTLFSLHRKKLQYIILISGIIILFLLAYSLIHSLFSAMSSTSWDTKNSLIQAQTLIIESQKLTSNRTLFNKNIQEAENILFKLRDDKEHMADTEDLLSRIEVMKKEVNDIQTVDLRKRSSIIKFNPSDISPLGVFENNKKLSLIWSEWAILDYSRWENLPKITTYPTGESWKNFTSWDDGGIFILTNNDRILTSRRGEFWYVTVTGENGWEKAKSIKLFNNNIYLLSSDGKSIFRHRPGINWYSAKTNMIEWVAQTILDIAIDGWVYIIEDSWKIQRYISGKTEWAPKWLIINKIPGEYTIGQSEPIKIVSQQNLSYIYILSGDRVWILSPDSKRFQDVNSLTYIAQLELETEEEIRDIYIPRDGTLYVTTNLWVYEVLFEMVDGKVLLR